MFKAHGAGVAVRGALVATLAPGLEAPGLLKRFLGLAKESQKSF